MITRFAGGQARALEYTEGPYVGVVHQALQGLAVLEPADADVAEVVNAMADRGRGFVMGQWPVRGRVSIYSV